MRHQLQSDDGCEQILCKSLFKNLFFKVNLRLVWYAEFVFKIDLKILLRKIGARLHLKIDLLTLHNNKNLANYRLLCIFTRFSR